MRRLGRLAGRLNISDHREKLHSRNLNSADPVVLISE
jgi:hypothetical protein